MTANDLKNMATIVYRRSKHVPAKVADKTAPCGFCGRKIDEEILYGKLYCIGNIYCHYFCALLSCCLIQKGNDEDGLFGFLYPDILAEIDRSKKHKCSYCGCDGASLGCSVAQCKKQFHLPCGRERNAVSLFYGNFKTYCEKHAPKQKISEEIMAKARERKAKRHNKKIISSTEITGDDATVCVICYEPVEGYPTVNTFWPPCCGRDAWFHRRCLERMALSAGVHYLKCPLCNDKGRFYEAVLQQGYYLPDRDAAWELEQNAFAEIYDRSFTCNVEPCLCPGGRTHDSDNGPWDISMCVMCGSSGAHARCRSASAPPEPYVCPPCAPSAASAPHLVLALHELAIQEQSQNTTESEKVLRPLMPCRMSLRRTKGRPANKPSSSTDVTIKLEPKEENTEASRLELNLKPPRRQNILEPAIYRNIENKLLSPVKLLEQGLMERTLDLNVEVQVDAQLILDKMRERFKRPKPLTIKKKIINNILEELLINFRKENYKVKEALREWHSPKKFSDNREQDTSPQIKIEKPDHKDCEKLLSHKIEPELGEVDPFDSLKLKTIDIEKDSSMEISEYNNVVTIDLTTVEDMRSDINQTSKACFKINSIDKEKLHVNNVDIDLESFKTQYLNEVRNKSNSENRKRKSEIDFTCDVKRIRLDEASTEVNMTKRLDKNETIDKRLDNSLTSTKNDVISIVLSEGDETYVEGLDKDETYQSVDVSKKRLKRGKCSKKKRIYKNKTIGMKRVTNNSILKKRLNNKETPKETDDVDLIYNGDETSTMKRLHKDEIPKKIRKQHRKILKISLKKKEKNPKVFKQYILNYDGDSVKNVIDKPKDNVDRVKRKYIKKKKPSDNLKQTSLDNFLVLNYK